MWHASVCEQNNVSSQFLLSYSSAKSKGQLPIYQTVNSTWLQTNSSTWLQTNFSIWLQTNSTWFQAGQSKHRSQPLHDRARGCAWLRPTTGHTSDSSQWSPACCWDHSPSSQTALCPPERMQVTIVHKLIKIAEFYFSGTCIHTHSDHTYTRSEPTWIVASYI